MEIPDDDVDDLDLHEPADQPKAPSSGESRGALVAAPRLCHVCERDITGTPPGRPCPYCGSGQNCFRCRNCGQTCLRFARRCPFCRHLYGLYRVENVARTVRAAVRSMADLDARPTPRIVTNVPTFDALAGGGLAVGSVTLFWGDPGTGKSTLLLQVCAACGVNVLYISGEEPLEQLTSRALRLGISKATNVHLLRSQSTEEILAALVDLQPRIIVVDSIQAFRSEVIDGIEGGHAQVRYLVNQIVAVIKDLPCAVILVGQVTADGRAAGPSRIQHMVDTLAYMRMVPNRGQYRKIFAPKNRFGPARFSVLLQMTERGLVECEPPAEGEEKPPRRKPRKSPFPI